MLSARINELPAIWQHCPNSCYKKPVNSLTQTRLLLSQILLEPPAASVLSESFLCSSRHSVQKKKKKKKNNKIKKKSVRKPALATGRQLLITGTQEVAATRKGQMHTHNSKKQQNKSSQLIVCAVKVCAHVHNKYNFLQLQCDLCFD